MGIDPFSWGVATIRSGATIRDFTVVKIFHGRAHEDNCSPIHILTGQHNFTGKKFLCHAEYEH